MIISPWELGFLDDVLSLAVLLTSSLLQSVHTFPIKMHDWRVSLTSVDLFSRSVKLALAAIAKIKCSWIREQDKNTEKLFP